MYLYAANANMADKCLSNADGDMLIVPQQGTLLVCTKCWHMLACRWSVVTDSTDRSCATDHVCDHVHVSLLPQVRTEFGVLKVTPKEICVVQRGMKFSIDFEGGVPFALQHRRRTLRPFTCAEILSCLLRVAPGVLGAVVHRYVWPFSYVVV